MQTVYLMKGLILYIQNIKVTFHLDIPSRNNGVVKNCYFLCIFHMNHPVYFLAHPEYLFKLCRFAILTIYAFYKCIVLYRLDEKFLKYNQKHEKGVDF